MSEDVRKVLHDPQRRMIAILCFKSKTSLEIFKTMQGEVKDYSPENLSSDLKELEEKRAIVYQDGKWETQDPSIKVLKKYYGYSIVKKIKEELKAQEKEENQQKK